MKTETIKLGLIDRLMKMQKASTLKRMDELLTQAEMESRAEESLEAIERGEVLSMDDFRKENKQWRERKFTK